MKKTLKFFVTLTLVLSVFCTGVFAATVGQTLTGPEAGWRRYDDKNSNLIYSQSWFDDSQSGTYNNSFKYTSTVGASVSFKFRGTKIRLITRLASTRSSGVKVTIDGIEEFHSQYSSSPKSQVLVYEKTNLGDSVHSVAIEHVQSGKECSLDAIDIDESGYLVPYYQTQDLSVTEVGDSKISLQWDIVKGATNYIIRYGTKSGMSKGDYPYTASPTVIDSVYGKCDLNGLINETTYYFRVGAIVNGVEQTLSNEVSAMPFIPIIVPDSPVNLAVISGDSKIYLSWNASQDAETYNIKRSNTAGGPYKTIAESSATTYTDSDVTNGTTYYYVVTAVNSAGESAYSNEVAVRIADKPILDITAEKDTVKINEEFTVDIVLSNVTNICAEDIRISYNTELFEYLGAEAIQGLKIYNESQPASGNLRYIIASLGKDNAVTGEKTLIRLKFKAKKAGQDKIDIIRGRIADNGTLEVDVEEANCGEKLITVEGIKDVNRTGEFTLLDLGIDAWYYGEPVANTDTTKYDADLSGDGTIDEVDLHAIVEEMLNNSNYTPNI